MHGLVTLERCICTGSTSPASTVGHPGWRQGDIDVRAILSGLPAADRGLYKRLVGAWDRGALYQFMNMTDDQEGQFHHLLCLEWAGLAVRELGFMFEPVLVMGSVGVNRVIQTTRAPRVSHDDPLEMLNPPGESTKLAYMRHLVRGWERTWGRVATLDEVAQLLIWVTGPEPYSPKEVMFSANLASQHGPDDPRRYTEGVLRHRRQRHAEIERPEATESPSWPASWPSVWVPPTT